MQGAGHLLQQLECGWRCCLHHNADCIELYQLLVIEGYPAQRRVVRADHEHGLSQPLAIEDLHAVLLEHTSAQLAAKWETQPVEHIRLICAAHDLGHIGRQRHRLAAVVDHLQLHAGQGRRAASESKGEDGEPAVHISVFRGWRELAMRAR